MDRVRDFIGPALALIGAAAFFFKPPSVKGIVLGLAGGYKRFNNMLLWARGMTPETEAERRIVTGKSWDEFCDSLKAAGAVLRGPGCPQDPFTQAEGYRYLSRLARGAIENFVECSDVCAPRLVALADGLREAPVKLGSDSPDNLYLNAMVSSEHTYRLWGQVGEAPYFGVGVQAGAYGKPGGLHTVAYMDRGQIGVPPDGKIDIIISADQRQARGAVWLQMDPSLREHMIIIRQTFGNRLTERPAKLRIERVFEGAVTPQALTASALDDALSTAGLFVGGASAMFVAWANAFQAHVNELPLFDQEKSNRAGGDPNIRYHHSYWRLQHNEALVVTVQPPACDSWNFQINNHWMESLDYRYFTVHVNASTAKVQSDGSVLIVLSGRDPCIEDCNWLDTCSHLCGTMCFRWIKPRCDPTPLPTCKVVPFDELLLCGLAA